MVADQLHHRVAAELAQHLVGQHQRHHGLGHHAHGRHGGDVGALLNDTVSALVTVSTVPSDGRFSVASGFMATWATSSSPVLIPPSTPPARVVSRR